MDARARITHYADGIQTGLIAAIPAFAALAFGGGVWWFRPACAVLVLILCASSLTSRVLGGGWGFLRSPLAVLGGLALLLALAQMAPMPGVVARAISPRSRVIHEQGALPERVLRDDPEAAALEGVGGRTPATLDRSATLRWLADASLCWVLFLAVGLHVDRRGRSLAAWGGVVSVFLLSGVIGLVQVSGGAEGLYGFLEAGSGPSWAPTLVDSLEVPGTYSLRELPGGEGWVVPRPDRPWAVGTMMGGPGAYVALGSLGLPLAVCLCLFSLVGTEGRSGVFGGQRQPGSRVGLGVFLLLMTCMAACLTGIVAGLRLSVPLALGVAVAGFPNAWWAGRRLAACLCTGVVLVCLGGGVAARGWIEGGPSAGFLEAAPGGNATTRSGILPEPLRIAMDFPLAGVGLGSYEAVIPYYKSTDLTLNHAGSSIFQWWAEGGLAGMAILVLGLLWVIARVPKSLGSLAPGERLLGFGMVGTVMSFGIFSAIHWSMELGAVAIIASLMAGMMDRWLAGGTDLFVEPDPLVL